MDSSKKNKTNKQTKYGGFIDKCECYHCEKARGMLQTQKSQNLKNY